MSFAEAIAWTAVALAGLLLLAALLWVCSSGGRVSCEALCSRLCWCCCRQREAREAPEPRASGGSRSTALRDHDLLHELRKLRQELPNLKDLDCGELEPPPACPPPPPGERYGPLYI